MADVRVEGEEATGLGWSPIAEMFLSFPPDAFPMTKGPPDAKRDEVRALLDRFSEGLLSVDPGGRVVFANRGLLELLNRREAQCVGRPVAELFADPDVPRDVIERLRAGGSSRATAARLSNEKGETRAAVVEAAAVFRDGRLDHSWWIVREPKDRPAVPEADTASRSRPSAEAPDNRLRDDFLAVLSHELRSPLGAILMWIRLLQQSGPQSAQTLKGLTVIERSAKSVERIIEDLLHVSRISAGKFNMSLQTVDFRYVVNAAFEAIEGDAALKGVNLERSSTSEPVVVSGDPGRLQQAVVNVLSNAVKFTPAGGTVRITLSRQEREAVVEVADDGLGMSPEFLPHAFERFRQQDSSSTRPHHGLGIGLYIVGHVVEQHGGRVTAASPGLGKGSTVTMSLPLVPALELPGPSAGSEPLHQGKSVEGLRILLVDDEEDTREALRLLLEQNGIVVETASSAASALERIEARKPDILLSDIAMPGEDGISLIQKVRSLPKHRGGEIAAAALTAYAGGEDRQKTLRAGFQHHIAKPVDPARLLAIIATMARSLKA